MFSPALLTKKCHFGTLHENYKCHFGTEMLEIKVPMLYNDGEVIIMDLKQLRTEKGLTQVGCSRYLQIPLRTYKRYENDVRLVNTIKYRYIVERLRNYGLVDEEHGVLSVEQIKAISADVLANYDVKYCYLFGSYAKGTATETSDVDLLVDVPVDGLKFFELAEMLREKLHKKIDLLDANQLNNNSELLHEILKYGVRIYG